MEACCYWLYANQQKYSFKKYTFYFIVFCIYKTKVLNSLNNPNNLNKYIITECVKREAISLIYVFQFVKQNILYTLFDDFRKINSEI